MTVQGRASHDGTPANKVETVSLCPRIGAMQRTHQQLTPVSDAKSWPARIEVASGVGNGDLAHRPGMGRGRGQEECRRFYLLGRKVVTSEAGLKLANCRHAES